MSKVIYIYIYIYIYNNNKYINIIKLYSIYCITIRIFLKKRELNLKRFFKE
jgi:hypothetical protein